MTVARAELYLDLDGTILDVSARYHALHVAVVAELGGRSALDRAAYWARKRAGLSNQALLREEGLDAVDPAAYLAAWLERIETDAAQALDAPLPGATEALDRLAARFDLVLVTLRHERLALLRSLDRLDLARRFVAVLSASPRSGEGPDAKAALIRARGRAAATSFLVGDTEIDVRAGKAAGLRTAAVASGIRSAERLRAEGPELLVDDLAAFAAAIERG